MIYPEETRLNEGFAEKAAAAGCEVIGQRRLCSLTTFKVGGECGGVVAPRSAGSCAALVRLLNEYGEDYFVIGKGSNIIADDRGIKRLIVLIGEEMSDISLLPGGEGIVCGAGASVIAASVFAQKQALTGFEFAYGIPGTVGGAVFMNAGAYGGEIKDIILYADAVDRESGEIRRFSPGEMGLSYRHSVFMEEERYIIVSAAFALGKGDSAAIKAQMDDIMQRRRDKQPLDYPSAGSTFKRPEGSYASLLIDQCGLKGFTVGGAQVSEKHCGFVINKGGATFDDIIGLMKSVRETVIEKTGYILDPEPVILTDRTDTGL